MHRLFLDANVLFSAAYKSKSGLLQLWQLKNVALCGSRYALEEARLNLPEEDQRIRLDRLSRDILFFEATHRQLPHGISLPEKDVPIFLAAIEAGATHLMTGDVQHFGSYFDEKIEGIEVVLPGSYLRLRSMRH